MSDAERIQHECPNLLLHGLMIIPRGRGSMETELTYEKRTRSTFCSTRILFDKMYNALGKPPTWTTLSMGMSQDYVWAIEEGSTMVRVGSSLFAGLEG
jgi:uncharacterized pyridoxal phosphate-containing UPF0001 family protein